MDCSSASATRNRILGPSLNSASQQRATWGRGVLGCCTWVWGEDTLGVNGCLAHGWLWVCSLGVVDGLVWVGAG
jgi:hypothetical protein